MPVSLLTAFRARFPQLISRLLVKTEGSTQLEIAYRNRPEVVAWISEDRDGYIVGVGFLHSHFDADSANEEARAEALEAALAQFERLVKGERVIAWQEGEVVASCAPEQMETLLKSMAYTDCTILRFE